MLRISAIIALVFLNSFAFAQRMDEAPDVKFGAEMPGSNSTARATFGRVHDYQFSGPHLVSEWKGIQSRWSSASNLRGQVYLRFESSPVI